MISNPNVKACVASRPWTAFEDAFRQSPGLMLEDLTKEDIKDYATSKLMDEEAFQQLQQLQPQHAETLIDQVVAKASGVFLWVCLVVASLIVGVSDGDRFSDLQHRLEALPVELEDLFASMIDKLRPEYRARAGRIFAFVQAEPDPLSVLVLALADEETEESVLHKPLEPLNELQAAAMYQSVRPRLKSRSMGLLEVPTDPDPPGGSSVD